MNREKKPTPIENRLAQLVKLKEVQDLSLVDQLCLYGRMRQMMVLQDHTWRNCYRLAVKGNQQQMELYDSTKEKGQGYSYDEDIKLPSGIIFTFGFHFKHMY